MVSHARTPLVFATVVTLGLIAGACDKSSAAPPTTTPVEDTAVTTAGADSGSEDAPADAAPTDGPAEGETPDPTETADDSGSAGTAVSGGPVDVPKDLAEGLEAPTSFASIKLEVKTDAGQVHRDEAKLIRWDEATRIPIDFQGQRHGFVVSVTRSGKKAEILLSYSLDGTEILRQHAFDTKIKKREVVRIEDGTAIAITVTPKTLRPRAPSHEKVENPEGNDPLTGVEKKK